MYSENLVQEHADVDRGIVSRKGDSSMVILHTVSLFFFCDTQNVLMYLPQKLSSVPPMECIQPNFFFFFQCVIWLKFIVTSQ